MTPASSRDGYFEKNSSHAPPRRRPQKHEDLNVLHYLVGLILILIALLITTTLELTRPEYELTRPYPSEVALFVPASPTSHTNSHIVRAGKLFLQNE